MRLVQLDDGGLRRGVALVDEPYLVFLSGVTSLSQLVRRSLSQEVSLTALVTSLATDERILYDEVYQQNSVWKLLTPVDTPGAPQTTLVSGTGLTHLGSARERQAMHAASAEKSEAEITDSMRMFEWGCAKGRPDVGEVGIAPEWFYKGDGSIIRAPFAPLTILGMQKTAAKRARLLPSISSTTTVSRTASECAMVMSSRITSLSVRTISTSPAPSYAFVPLALSSLSAPTSLTSPARSAFCAMVYPSGKGLSVQVRTICVTLSLI
jgi:hypothetical protein